MRDLFLSEQRYIRNILLRNLGARDVVPVEPVLSEYYAPPRLGPQLPRFNTDFVLRFVEKGSMPEHRSFCARVLPNTMGAEVFVTVDAKTGRPLMTELDSGEAFPLEHFRAYIEKIESVLGQLDVAMRFEESSYCRVFVVDNDVCFLAFPQEASPVIRENKEILMDGTQCSIAAYVAHGEIVCVDGWMKTYVPDSEWYLVAETDEGE